jgi:pyrimidine deaminase RibD-like protein
MNESNENTVQILSDTDGMALALEWAAKGMYITAPNPRIGCVIVRDGEVIGAGHTQPAGQAHAEIQALRDAQARGNDVRGATAYVTLEPCSHYGRTPPCSNALIQAGLGRVVAAMGDPNPLVAGRGMAQLEAAGIAVSSGLLADEAYELNIGFFNRMRFGQALGAPENRGQPGWRHGAGQRRKPVDHRPGSARRRPRLARPRQRDPDRHRHRQGRRSAADVRGIDTGIHPASRAA